jgi:hypothetical protein
MEPTTTPTTPALASTLPITRDGWGALIHLPEFARVLMREAEAAGVYATGMVRNRRGTRGTAINHDLYGYDAARDLALIQVRECQFAKNRFHRVRKNYFLLGHTEDGRVFAHPVESPARSKRAMGTPEACVRWVLARIWDCAEADLDEILRQGDVAFVPATLPKGAVLLPETSITLRGTHVITAEAIYRHGETYYTIRKARAVHTKGEHAPVRANGCYRVQPGIRASVWAFTTPTID